MSSSTSMCNASADLSPHHEDDLNEQPTSATHGLPDARNCDGRPIWEPPIFNYSDLIGDEFERMKDAVLKFTEGDKARTSLIMDKMIEYELMDGYTKWVADNEESADTEGGRRFFAGLWEEAGRDLDEDDDEWWGLWVKLAQRRDGTWVAMSVDEWFRTKAWGWNTSAAEDSEGRNEGEEPASPSAGNDSDAGGDSVDSNLHYVSNPVQEVPTADFPRHTPFPQQPQPVSTRVRSLSPNWRIRPSSSAVSVPSESHTSSRVPLALQMVALRSVRMAGVKETVADEDVD